MAITPQRLPEMPVGMDALRLTDFDRFGDRVLRFGMMPVEIFRFTGDGTLTSVSLTTNMTRVFGGMVFNATSGTNWVNSITATPNGVNPAQVDIANFPANTNVYIAVIFGDKVVPEHGLTVNAITPTVPDGLVAVVNSATQITISWNAATHINGLAVSYDYRVNASTITSNGALLTKAVTGLTAATLYSFEVRSKVTDSYGNTVMSAWSPVVSAKTA